jgi:lysophospholipase L1-like esterase
VVLGGNDILRRAGRAEVERGLRRWADLLKQQGRPVLFVSVPGAVISDGYAGVWRDVAKEYGFASMNERALRTILTTPAMTTDGIHFNARGANHFAEAVEKRIRGG